MNQKKSDHWVARHCRPVIFLILTLSLLGGYLVFTIPVSVFPSTNFPRVLIGVDNGDLRSPDSYQANSRTTYLGNALAVVQSTGAPGLIVFTALADGLPAVSTGVLAVA